MLLRAHAKINLSLDVTGVRPNGYHDVRMIMQSVGIYDELNIQPNDEGRILCSCQDETLPCDESNLIYRAARAILDYAGIKDGVTIRLTKNIPIAAGMAGGSTDAAATLIGINRLLGLGYSNETLREIGVKLGADIPFCIEGGTYLSEGIGEVLTRLPDAPQCTLVVIKPDISVSTKMVYDKLVLDENTPHPDVDSMIEAIRRQDITGVTDNLDNLLATVTEALYPVISDIKHLLLNKGATSALMSGSGPTVFGIFNSSANAAKALESLHSSIDFKQGFVTELSRQGVEIIG